MDRWKHELSNWVRRGADDHKGTLNLITPAKRKQAASLVRDGGVVSLAREAETERAVDNNSPYEHVMTRKDSTRALDRIGVQFHGFAHTHLDALAHHFYDDKMYNGFSGAEFVTMQAGATKNAIINVADGVFTRGIMYDIPRLEGVPYLEPGTPIYVEDLEAWERQAGVKAKSGDAIFIRTGRWARRAEKGPWNVAEQAAGLDASVIPWLKTRIVAILASETGLSVTPLPPTSTSITSPDDDRPAHNFALVALGAPVIDDCDLDRLASEAATRHRWEFLLTMAPLALRTATGSPINPTAVF